jgi:hypothetical protein
VAVGIRKKARDKIASACHVEFTSSWPPKGVRPERLSLLEDGTVAPDEPPYASPPTVHMPC